MGYNLAINCYGLVAYDDPAEEIILIPCLSYLVSYQRKVLNFLCFMIGGGLIFKRKELSSLIP